MAFRPLPGYPMQVGDKVLWVGDVDGPASYNNTGTFNTSGQQINASDLGFGGLEYVECDTLSSDGVNAAQIVPGATIAGATNLQPAPPSPPALAMTSFVIHWYTTPASSTEVTNATNLSGKYLRLRVMSPTG